METRDREIGPLVCFAKGRPGEWEAICLTFDIAVQGASEEEVQHSLRQAIALFLQSARDERDPKVREKLLRRRAPVGVWLRYASSFFLHVVLGRHRRSDGYSEAALSCRAQPKNARSQNLLKSLCATDLFCTGRAGRGTRSIGASKPQRCEVLWWRRTI